MPELASSAAPFPNAMTGSTPARTFGMIIDPSPREVRSCLSPAHLLKASGSIEVDAAAGGLKTTSAWQGAPIMPPSWKIAGSYFEACNCDVACPCVFTSPPTSGECTVLVAWHIDEGRFGDLELDGLNAVLAAHSPGHMLQVKWRVALYVDQRADQSQRDALTQIFSGQAGGHLAGLAPLIGEVLGVKAAPIEYRSEGRQRRLRLGDVGGAEIEGLPGQDGGEVTLTNHPFTAVPAFPAVVAKSKQMTFRDYGLKWEVSNKNGFFSPFVYQST